MIPVGLFVFMMLMAGAIIFILFFNLISSHQSISDQKEKIRDLTFNARYWNGQYEKMYRDYLIALKKGTITNSKSSGGGPTWRNIMGFSKEEVVTKSMLDQRYKALAKVYHPDVPTGSTHAMKFLNLAKEKGDKVV